MGFLKTLGKVGLGLGSMVPGVGPIIGAASKIINERGGAPKPGFAIDNVSQAGTPEDRARVSGASDSLTGLSQYGSESSKQFLGQAGEAFGGAGNYYKSLMSGDAATTMQSLQPEMDQIRKNTAGSLDMINKFGARGGGSAQAGRDARLEQAGSMAKLFSQARPMAAQGMMNLGQAQGGIGTSMGNMSMAAGQAGGNLALGQMNQNQAVQQMNNSTQLGQAQIGSTEAITDANRDAEYPNVMAQQGGLGGVLSKIPGLNKIPGMDKVFNILGNSQSGNPAAANYTAPPGTNFSPTQPTQPSGSNIYTSPNNPISNMGEGLEKFNFGGPSATTTAFSGQKSPFIMSQYDSGRKALA